MRHNGQNEVNCSMLKVYRISVPPDGIPRYLAGLRYNNAVNFKTRYFFLIPVYRASLVRTINILTYLLFVVYAESPDKKGMFN